MNKISEGIKAKIDDEEEILVGDTKVCLYCMEKIAKDASRCPHYTSIIKKLMIIIKIKNVLGTVNSK